MIQQVRNGNSYYILGSNTAVSIIIVNVTTKTGKTRETRFSMARVKVQLNSEIGDSPFCKCLRVLGCISKSSGSWVDGLVWDGEGIVLSKLTANFCNRRRLH